MKIQFSQSNVGFICLSFVFTLLMGFCLDIHSKISFLNQEFTAITKMQQQISNEKKLINHRDEIQNEWNHAEKKVSGYLRHVSQNASASNVSAELLTAILRASETNGLVIESIEPLSEKSQANQITVHLIVTGRFIQFVEFIETLSLYTLPMTLTDFTLHSTMDNLVSVDMQLVGFYIPTERSNVDFVDNKNNTVQKINFDRDPFLTQQSSHEISNQDTTSDYLLHSVSLQQIKLVGYVHEGRHFWALAKLPNGKTLVLMRDGRIGWEEARVIKLNEQSVVVEIAGKPIKLSYVL